MRLDGCESLVTAEQLLICFQLPVKVAKVKYVAHQTNIARENGGRIGKLWRQI